MCTFHKNKLDYIFNFGSEILQLLCFGGNQIEMGEIGSAAVIILCLFPLQPLFRIWSSAISDLKETSRKPSLFCSNGFNWARYLKEADVNSFRPTPAVLNVLHIFQHLTVWYFDDCVDYFYDHIVYIFTSVFNAMRQLLGRAIVQGCQWVSPSPKLTARSLDLFCPNAQILKYTKIQIHKYTNTQMHIYTNKYKNTPTWFGWIG